MKEASQFHFIESELEHFIDPSAGHNFFEQEKVAYPFQDHQDKEGDQQGILKTPKSKRGRKFSIKNNPEDHSASKQNKIKQKKYKCMSVDKQKNPNQLFGHWSVEENKRYHWFLEIYHSHFMNRSLRRMDRIFTSMAKFVGTREAQQCRSHHQKMQKKHKTFPKILLSLRMTYYGNHNDIYLREDIDANDVTIIDPLLSEQFLIENLTLKEIPHDNEEFKEEDKSESEDMEEKPRDINEKAKKSHEAPSADMIEEVLAQEPPSSNYCFNKFLPHSLDRNNILDDGYESNLPFNGFF